MKKARIDESKTPEQKRYLRVERRVTAGEKGVHLPPHNDKSSGVSEAGAAHAAGSKTGDHIQALGNKIKAKMIHEQVRREQTMIKPKLNALKSMKEHIKKEDELMLAEASPKVAPPKAPKAPPMAAGSSYNQLKGQIKKAQLGIQELSDESKPEPQDLLNAVKRPEREKTVESQGQKKEVAVFSEAQKEHVKKSEFKNGMSYRQLKGK